jgi:hypothetical protein
MFCKPTKLHNGNMRLFIIILASIEDTGYLHDPKERR